MRIRPRPRRACVVRALWPAGAAILLAAGCGGGRLQDGPPAQPARGSLFINGQPAVAAQVTLHPADGKNFDTRGSRPTGRVGDDGAFRLSTYEVGDGAPEGDYVVTVYWPAAPNSDEPSPDRVGGRLLDPKLSKHRVRINPGDNDIPPLQIELPEDAAAGIAADIADDVDALRRRKQSEGTANAEQNH
jgi:hypothetical protein